MSDNRSRAAALEQVLADLREQPDRGPILLINNAGVGVFGEFAPEDIDDHRKLVEVNISAVLAVTAALLPLLRERGGAIMNLASIVSFQPSPRLATYGASKAFILQWSYALRAELKDAGVKVLAVCPGPTASDFHDVAGMRPGALSARFMQTSDEVVTEAMAALRSDRGHVVTGWLNKLQCFISARLPLRFTSWCAARVLAGYSRRSRLSA